MKSTPELKGKLRCHETGLILLLPGFGDGHVEAHELVGRLEDDGGDEEGGRIRSSPARQLHRPDTSKKYFLRPEKSPIG